MPDAGQRVLSEIHQMGKQREGDLQAGRQQGGLPPVGHAQEQARHELRDYGTGTKVVFLVLAKKLILDQ